MHHSSHRPPANDVAWAASKILFFLGGGDKRFFCVGVQKDFFAWGCKMIFLGGRSQKKLENAYKNLFIFVVVTFLRVGQFFWRGRGGTFHFFLS